MAQDRGGTDVNVSGSVAADGSAVDLALSGNAPPLALANPFIAPRQLDGLATYTLALNGPPELSALSGTVQIGGARAALPPLLRLALEPVNATLNISGGRAQVDARATVSSGGQITVSGPIGLTAPPYLADMALGINAVGLKDPTLYDTTANGTLRLSGPVTRNALLAGTITLGTVELRIPETGFGADGALPDLTHIGAPPAAVQATRARAGLIGQSTAGGGTDLGGLDLTISAPPDRVFLRGRGLDAELGGGELRLGGTTSRIEAQGGFELIRGRLDLLGNRLTLTEARATLQGDLDPPYVLVKAETQIDDVTVLIRVEGPATEPEVSFTSSPPDLPEDEILARLVFGRGGLDQISPFQALKLASAVATLSGRGGGAGTISRLRSGFGLDDLDVTTDDEGELSVRAGGAYISDNLYSDVTVGADGQSEINLNLTVTPSVTVRGQVSSDGDTGIGVFFERDY